MWNANNIGVGNLINLQILSIHSCAQLPSAGQTHLDMIEYQDGVCVFTKFLESKVQRCQPSFNLLIPPHLSNEMVSDIQVHRLAIQLGASKYVFTSDILPFLYRSAQNKGF